MTDPAATPRRRALRLFMGSAVAAAVLQSTRTEARGWRLAGEASARRSVDRDEIRVRSDRAFTAIRLRLFDAPEEILTLRIRFRNGESREIEVRQFLERSGTTRVIDLPGERRFIDRLVFWHRTPSGARNPARVQVWARA